MKLPSLRFGEGDLRLAAEQLGKRATFESLLSRMRDKPTTDERRAYRDLVRRLTAELCAGITAGKYGDLRLKWHSASAAMHGEGSTQIDQSYRTFDAAALVALTEFMSAHPEECTQKGATKWAAMHIAPYDRDKVRRAARKLPGYHGEKRGRKPKAKLGG
jgi:hypothetical protein